jgi:choice-of-anchor C domain-containing protein
MKLSQLIQVGAFATIAVFGSANAATNLIINGDFETFSGNPVSGFKTVNAGDSALGNWLVGGTSIDVINGAYGAISGNSIDMLGTPGPGSLSQKFTTTVGSLYSLAFDLSRNPGSSADSSMTVGVAGNTYAYTGTDLMTHYTKSFTALTGMTTLTFNSAAAGYSGPVLDNVSVSAVPEPSTYALMLGGLGLMGFMARRRKQG